MRDVVLQAWHGIALGALMGLITLMMVTGLGSRRGTWLHRVRISLWSLVMGLGGAAAGCGETEYVGHPDGSDTRDMVSCYIDVGTPDFPDTTDTADDAIEDSREDEPWISCYQAPWDPGEEDARSEPVDVEDEDVEEESE